MNKLSEHRAMSSIIQNRVTEYADNMTMLLDRIASLESKIQELEQKIDDVNDIEYY